MSASLGDAHPYPIYNARYRVMFPILDADGDLVTGATGLDSEASQDQGTFADCTNEATEIATSSGMYYLDLTAGEMDTKSTAIIVKTTSSGAKTTPMVLYPKRMSQLRTGTAQAGAATTITLDSGASATDNFYAGCYVNITNNSPANAQGQARLIISYVGSTKVATVEVAWGTNPSSASTFEILDPEGSQNVRWAGGTVPDPNTAGYPITTIKDGTGTGEIDTTSGGVLVAALANNAITAASIATDAITNAKIAADAIGATEIADGAIDAATFAAGAINAAAIAADAITNAKIAADAIGATEIADGAIDAATFAAGAINAAAIAADAITAAKIATDAIGSDEIAASAVTEIQSGLATSASIVTLQADTDDIQTRLPAALVGGRIDASVGAMAAAVLTATAIAADAITSAKIATDAITSDEIAASAVTEIQSGLATSAALTTVQADTDDIQTRLPAALVGGRMDSSVGAMAAAVLTATAIAADAITAAKIATDAIGSDELATTAVTEIVEAVLKTDWDGMTGEATHSALNALRFLRNKWELVAGSLTVYKEDSTTVAWSETVTATPGADPVTGVSG